ncbi:MAG: RNA 2',3'-cyclic phosphodiesterase [bacterium]
MRHRVFIAINLPEGIKKQLADCRTKWLELPARWTKKENLHITLIFLSYLSDQELLEVCQAVKEVVLKQKSFLINLTRICYGPPKKMPPRIVWAEGDKSQEFSGLRQGLSNYFSPEERAFSPHITLARIKTWEWKKIEPEERPEVEEEIDLSFEVNSIEVMESDLKKTGPEYTILESFPFGINNTNK